ncbi:lipoate--protein ligase family protein [Acidithiobacillus sp. CV18-2]|uniref:Lipoate--protein ligase family protein n=1 Tax=Igneacidithiobacillus copahuensis TaxID=2724909 RepID=A0AAE3CKR4_9PROT|nr:lipoate--protein ligase family protein [Acidithiobacillus sp. CV18-3]MBU2758394.1 lipoate--protein ligase family protein [Acidithiobacillus sp. BN09-2]MBU2776726.1 lipoate--protein ligase family protein [Acidithiobacillus sp. CV18-2]MBU2788765.1 lipoate--protein ligase family protein [Igneacidithiobacillus copahuensis]MBU2795445.1 lipoate--protein ligase family protein [Acidithiobacillus sp. VAN18-2]MBU2799019.1 lipoate--protein ligase family protein [Acidithiobacillus sp. VAN18-4]
MAEARRADDPAFLVLATADAHLSLGAAQAASAELNEAACASIAVLQRPLGGGLVWVEPAHLNYFLLATPDVQCRRPEDLLARLAPSIQAVHAQYGLPVKLAAGQEFRCRGRRIGSTGAATIGKSLVLAGSFLLQTDWHPFVASVAAPSPGFRNTLARALSASLTSWETELGLKLMPSHADLQSTWKAQLLAQGWQIFEEELHASERAAWQQVEWEPMDWQSQGRRRVRNGIKLRAGAFLTEQHWPDAWLRVWTEDGCYREVESDAWPPELSWALAGVAARSPLLASLLDGYLGSSARLWQQRLEELSVWSDQ